MTKKSAGRILRDAKKKEQEESLKTNRCWDDLNEIYAHCVGLLRQHAQTAALAGRTDLIAVMGDTQTLIANIRSLGNDLLTMNTELLQISDQHKTKTGGSTDPDDLIRSFQISEQYHLFMTRHDGVIMPTVYHILEEFGRAEQILMERHAAAQQDALAQEQASDPTHTDPIDVNFTEAPVLTSVGYAQVIPADAPVPTTISTTDATIPADQQAAPAIPTGSN